MCEMVKKLNKTNPSGYISPFHISIIQKAPVGVIFLPACADRPKLYV